MRHVAVMASTGAVGLVAVFLVDLINLFYISQLGEQAIAAAVGFAGVVGFFHTSICIGLMIGITATVSRRIGAGDGFMIFRQPDTQGAPNFIVIQHCFPGQPFEDLAGLTVSGRFGFGNA